MKLNRLETHDRLLHFKKDQESNIVQGINDCLKKNFDSLFYQERSPYVYIFGHPRTDDDGVTKRMLWQPRLQKPEAQINSYLVRAVSGTDIVEPIWFIPPPEMWSQFKTGNVTENEFVNYSVQVFLSNKKKLEAKDPDDLSEEKSRQIVYDLIQHKRQNKMMNRVYDFTQDFSEASLSSPSEDSHNP